MREKGAEAHCHQDSYLSKLHSHLQLDPSRGPSLHLCPSAEPSQWPYLTWEFTWQFCLILVSRQWTKLTLEPFLPSDLGREANSQPRPTAEHGLHLPHQKAWLENPSNHGTHPTALLDQGTKPAALPSAERSLWHCIIRESGQPQSSTYSLAQPQNPAYDPS